MASPSIGPNGPHLTEEKSQTPATGAGSGTTNPAQQFVESIGPEGPHVQAVAEEDIGPEGPHLTEA